MGKKEQNSALNVTSGVQQPESLNREAIKNLKALKKPIPNAVKLLEGIEKGDITTLSRAITLIESALPEHYEAASEIISKAMPLSGKSIRIGITGVPGAGKSTFIESFGNFLLSQGHKIAVLAIDPSSERSGGSILGDKTRMETLAGNKNAFIRPSPSGGTLGGVARKTRESVVLCEAAGFDVIIIETVGVGQSETTVQSMTDFFLALMIPGAGDELQGMKRGIMEMVNALVVNKADGDFLDKANRSKAEYTNALHLYPLPPSGWAPRVLTCSSIEGTGINEVWKIIKDYKDFSSKNGFFKINRNQQNKYWLYQTLQEGLNNKFFNLPEIKEELQELEELLKKDQISPFSAAQSLLSRFFPDNK